MIAKGDNMTISELEALIAEAKTNWKKTIGPTKQGWEDEYVRLELELEALKKEVAKSN